MSGRAAAACIDILAGLPKLLQYTLLQMAIFSDLHRSREITRLNFFVSMYSLRNNQPREKFITTCGNVPINFFIRLVTVLSPAIFDLPRTAAAATQLAYNNSENQSQQRRKKAIQLPRLV